MDGGVIINNFIKYKSIKLNRVLLKRTLLFCFLCVFVSCNNENKNIKKNVEINNTSITKKVCLSSEESILFFRGTTGNDNNIFWGIPSTNGSLNNSILKVDLNKTDYFEQPLDFGQGPGDINDILSGIYYSNDLFILANARKDTTYQLFDENMKFLMKLVHMPIPIDINFNPDSGDIFIALDCNVFTIENNDFWQNKDELKNESLIYIYSLVGKSAKLRNKMLTFFDIKELFLNEGASKDIFKEDTSFKFKFINQNNAIIAFSESPFFLLYNLENKTYKKINFEVNPINKNKRNKGFRYMDSSEMAVSNKYFYYTQNNMPSKTQPIRGYMLYKYDFNGKLIDSFDIAKSFDEESKYKGFLIADIFVTSDDTILAQEYYFPKDESSVDVLLIKYDINYKQN